MIFVFICLAYFTQHDHLQVLQRSSYPATEVILGSAGPQCVPIPARRLRATAVRSFAFHVKGSGTTSLPRLAISLLS